MQKHFKHLKCVEYHNLECTSAVFVFSGVIFIHGFIFVTGAIIIRKMKQNISTMSARTYQAQRQMTIMIIMQVNTFLALWVLARNRDGE